MLSNFDKTKHRRRSNKMRQEVHTICPKLHKMSEERQELNPGAHFTAQSMFKMVQYNLYKLMVYL